MLMPILALCGDAQGGSPLELDPEADAALPAEAPDLIPACVAGIAAFRNDRRGLSRPVKPSRPRPSPACNYPHLSAPNQRLAGFVQIVSLCAELFEGPPRQVTLSGSNID